MLRAQPKDIEQTTIAGSINEILDVQVFPTTSGVWVPITLDSDESKQIALKPRVQSTWYFATSSGSSSYMTFWDGATLEANLVCASGVVLGWALLYEESYMELLIGR